jgi:hypothetical protein
MSTKIYATKDLLSERERPDSRARTVDPSLRARVDAARRDACGAALRMTNVEKF